MFNIRVGWATLLINALGVNQGGVASGLLFRKYMADLESFLAPEYGICIEENIIAHILWAHDLVLLSDSEKGMQNQLDGLLKFCSLNLMSVNEIKKKSMAIGNRSKARINLTFNKKDIEQVNQYKCFGVIDRLISGNNEDIFAYHTHTCVIRVEKPYLVFFTDYGPLHRSLLEGSSNYSMQW